jgi:hypothetical protein
MAKGASAEKAVREIRRVFEELPRATTLAEIELLLPHRIELRPSPEVKS